MSFFATDYTIHFDDTMAYGSHHFLTTFKFQCASRESLLFSDTIFDSSGVRAALDQIHLFTTDAYTRNLHPAKLGARVAILLTLEDWGRASTRFCFRVIDEDGQPICAGFQTVLCADAATGNPIPLPAPLWNAMQSLREIEEFSAPDTFRTRVLAGGSKTESLFGAEERQTATLFLAERYPRPQVVAAQNGSSAASADEFETTAASSADAVEAWVFAGQGAFDPHLLSARIAAYTLANPAARQELEQCASIAQELLGGDAMALVSQSPKQCADAANKTPALTQVAIHLQNVLGARLRQSQGHIPGLLVGHSFGEIAALGVGGCFDLPTGVRAVCERVRAITEFAPTNGGLLAIGSDRPSVSTEIAVLGLDRTVIAGRNHSRQTVASGPCDELEQLREHLRQRDISATTVPSPTSFHHPEMRSAASAWFEQLDTMGLSGPTTPVYSPIGRRFISQDDAIAATLASQFIRPFDFQGGIADMVAAGVTRFVDCGSSGSLARIISKAIPQDADVGEVEVVEPTTLTPPAGPDSSGNAAAPATNGVAKAATHDQSRLQEKRVPPQRDVPSVAIVGRGCILPGGANSPEQLYSAISEQRIGIVDQRQFDPHWSEDFYSAQLVPDRSTSHLTGRVKDDQIVAPPGIDAQVFRKFTRAQRLLSIALAPCIASLKSAERILCLIGATADGFEDQDVVASLHYSGIDPLDPDVDARLNSARSALQEPHDAIQEVIDRVVRPGIEVIVVDAACASSLYTVALGMQALELNEADAVIAGGMFCPGPGNSCLFSQFHGTTSTGCRPFDANVDGVVFSEGSALVTLRRLTDAKRLSLPITAVLRGVGLSSDGRSSSANVPQTHGQLLSLERCYANYNVDPASIHAIEGHGTSTPVGDSTELETLRQFFEGRVTAPLPLHSLKGLLGHAGWAAGTASVIAACEYMRNGQFPAQALHREPSEALVKSDRTLKVLASAEELPSRQKRIAVDGFGFGGANAHLVLESYVPDERDPRDEPPVDTTESCVDEDLVFVAYCQLSPTKQTPTGMRFDRGSTELPEGHVVLPDLADDMDISQTLAVLLVDKIVAQIPQFDSELRRQTGVVLAQSGKTERGVESTLRVLAPRFRRNLVGLEELTGAVTTAAERARPSGPYTLQCMMPNVSAGRAALQLNLNGPNFVVDAGSRSLEAALASTSLLLRSGDESGTRLVILAAIDANPWRIARNQTASPAEYAAAFAVTTRRYAQELGLKVVSDVKVALQTDDDSEADRGGQTTAAKVGALLRTLDGEGSAPAPSLVGANVAEPSESTDFPIHTPVWVESPLIAQRGERETPATKSMLAIAPPNPTLVAQLSATLPRLATRYLVAVVGPNARDVATRSGSSHVIGMERFDDLAGEKTLNLIDELEAETVVAVDAVTSWDVSQVLTNVADRNDLCEFLFLVAQRYACRLKEGALELWGLYLDGWRDVVHPASGGTAGLLKAIRRELPAARVGVVCTRGVALDQALDCLHAERRAPRDECEVVYDGKTRLVRRLRRVVEVKEVLPQVALDANSVVVATGGARGVTAVMMDALLREYQCTVVAIGRSPLEAGPTSLSDAEAERDFYEQFLSEHPNGSAAEMKEVYELTRARWEAHRTIQQLSSLGGRVEYMVADVTDRNCVATVIQQIVSKFGRIDLLVHGAGVQMSKRLEHRNLADFQTTYAVKVSGLHNLIERYYSQTGKMLNTHVLTSAYSIFGNDGQHDYGAANETLDRLCNLSAIHDDQDWSSIAWLAWDGIGMTRGSEYHALAKQRGLSGLTAEDGQRVFRQVLSGRTQAAINVPISDAEHVKYAVKTLPPPVTASTGRLLELNVELSKMECLPFHKVRNTPTLPGAWILERMVNAGLQLYEDAACATSATVHDATFSRFVRYSVHQEPNIRVVAEETADGIAVWMVGDILHPTGATLAKDLVFASATLCFENAAVELQPSLRDIHSPNGQGVHRSLSDPYCNGQCSEVQLSGPFDCVRDIAIGPTGRHARFVPQHSPSNSSVIPALLLDSAWRVGAMYAAPDDNALYVPVRIGRVIAPIGAGAQVPSASVWEIRSTAPKVEDGHVRWDRTEVISETGAVKLVVEDAFATRVQ